MQTAMQSNPPEITLSALSHLAFCALVGLGIARQEGVASTPLTEHLFLVRWLATAQNKSGFQNVLPLILHSCLSRDGEKAPPASCVKNCNTCGDPALTPSSPNRTYFDSPMLPRN